MDAGVLLPAALAGCVAIGASVAVERLGGRTGGMVASLPSTIVPSAIGLYAEGDPAHLRAALAMVPVGMLLNAAFLWLWRVVPPRLPAWSLGRRLGLMTAISTTAWGA
ncbi:MAG TPA: hypothetical protein PKA64_17305, partial [Myxococcota bacterium]|nr:hypothetical protein [Myxococcota bacterium]